MKYVFAFLFVLFFNILESISQGYECDNNHSECGSPNQSGGGGGGKGSILINNTDLGDSYQNADDFDDDGIEDSNDNCVRIPNIDQLDRDADGIGDMCDNCLIDWNPDQKNIDNDLYGDYCDNDIDNDSILNEEDQCPFHWGNDVCFTDFKYNKSQNEIKNHDHTTKADIFEKKDKIDHINQKACYVYKSKNIFYESLILLLFFYFLNKIYYFKEE